MGRIKTKFIKRISKELFRSHEDEFKEDFNENKKLVSEFAQVNSKKFRNILAGYLTKLAKEKENL